MYLFVCMVVGVDVVVKLLVSEVLLVTQLTVEESLQILHRAAQSPLGTFLEKQKRRREQMRVLEVRRRNERQKIEAHSDGLEEHR